MFLKNEKFSAIALILLLSFVVFITALAPIVGAHDPPWTIPTYAYVSASPDTVGVGQYTLITMWLDKYPPTAGGTGGDLWRGYQLEITKPDGTKEVQGPFTSSTIGGAWVQYVPDQVGNYTLVFSWPGQTLTNGTGVPNQAGVAYVGDYFEGATSDPVILQVLQDPVEEWVEPSLPTEYWTRPIPTSNRNWAQLTSNWLGGSWLVGNFQRWGTAPNTAHILYAKPIINGGIADQSFNAVKYDTTDYENFFPDPIIMSGKIYYNAGTYPNYGYYCVDLKTGELIWYKNGTDNGLNNPVTKTHLGGGGADGPNLAESFPQLSFGQLYHYYSVNGEGIKDHLWMTMGSTWYMLDANTGNWVLTLKNVPGGTTVTDQNGNILRYSYDSKTGNLLCWNVTQSIPPPSPTGTGQQQWEPRIGTVIDAVNDTSWTEYGPKPTSSGTPWFADDIYPRSGYTLNLTVEKGLPGSITVLQDSNRVPKLILGSDFGSVPSFGGSDITTFSIWLMRIDEHVAPYSPQPDKTATQNNNLGFGATLLYYKNITVPLDGNRTWYLGPVSYDDGVFTVWSRESRQWWGYNLTDGSLLWGPTASQGAWDMYGRGTLGSDAFTAYGRLFSGSYGGILYCYDIKTGELLWTYTAKGIGHESPYGNYPIGRNSIVQIADGKIFLTSNEHSPTQPMWRGSYLRAVDVYSGKELWKSHNFVSGMAIADGCIVAGNHYDNQMYVYGKGPSKTTVDAPNIAVPKGTGILIKGTVTDQSPGAKDTPAISDADMNAWMDYLYMKQARPENAKGVPVKLQAILSNGETIDIGIPTSDANGNYEYLWTPSTEGTYKIIATFEGSESYYGSHAATAVAVGPAASQPPQQQASVSSLALPIEIYAFFAIVIIFMAVLTVLVIKKR